MFAHHGTINHSKCCKCECSFPILSPPLSCYYLLSDCVHLFHASAWSLSIVAWLWLLPAFDFVYGLSLFDSCHNYDEDSCLALNKSHTEHRNCVLPHLLQRYTKSCMHLPWFLVTLLFPEFLVFESFLSSVFLKPYWMLEAILPSSLILPHDVNMGFVVLSWPLWLLNEITLCH